MFASTLIRRSVAAAGLLVAFTAAGEAQQASPRDSAKVTIGAAHLSLDYGRPSMRGREIFGGLVPYGQPWRAGANRATHFTTDKALAFGSTTVPAGTYTLHVLPISATAWKLIISKKVDIWGIPYPEGEDLVRLDMTVAQTPAPVEAMEIVLAAQGSGGVLKIRWARTEGSIPFTVRP
ncbi:MAG: DUF2911 domain-containing protein [Gemmatimonadota bacterium]|nr:DUF2911 domain-containing protein [Gemmatimonadota bacterium]